MKLKNVKTKDQLLPVQVTSLINLPRYIRVNTIKTTVNEVINYFKSSGYKIQPNFQVTNTFFNSQPSYALLCNCCDCN